MDAGGTNEHRAIGATISAVACQRRRGAYHRALHALDDRTLKDIGLHRHEIAWALTELPTSSLPARVHQAQPTEMTKTIRAVGGLL